MTPQIANKSRPTPPINSVISSKFRRYDDTVDSATTFDGPFYQRLSFKLQKVFLGILLEPDLAGMIAQYIFCSKKNEIE